MLIEMLYLKVVLNLVIIWISFLEVKSSSEDEIMPYNDKLISSLRNDANLDLPPDEEYEDLRAELLAYHSAFAQLSDSASLRRSMRTTACWNLGGICINYKLCEGYRFLTEVPGCKDRLTVCCFAWNKFYVRDWSYFGYPNIAFPWGSLPEDVGIGKGIIEVDSKGSKDSRKAKNKNNVIKLKPVIEENAKVEEILTDQGDILETSEIKPSTRKESKTAESQKTGLRNLKIYKIALPPQNKLQKKPILRSLRSNPIFVVANVET